MIVIFNFEHIPAPAAAPETMPSQYRYLGMDHQLAARRDQFVGTLSGATAGATPYQKPIWIPPVRTAAQPAKPKEPSSEPQAKPAPTVIGSAEDFVKRTVGLFQGGLDYEVAAQEALKAAQLQPGAYEVSIGGQDLFVDTGIYSGLLASLEKRLLERLTKRADQLEADIQFLEKKLNEHLSEGTVNRALTSIWKGGHDIDLDPHMFDRPKAHLASARVGLSRNVFRAPLDSLRAGEALVASARSTLTRYETGYTID
jgi:hypothetical protein